MPLSMILLTTLILAAGATSLSVLFWLFQKHIDGRPLLPFAPRRPVPWNAVAPLAVLAPMISVLVLGGAGEPVEESLSAAAATAAAHGAAAAGGSTAAASYAGLAAAVETSQYMNPDDDLVRAVWSQAAATLLLTAATFVVLTFIFGATAEDLGLPVSGRQLAGDVAIGGAAFFACLAPVYVMQLVLINALESDTVHPLIEQLQTQHSTGMMAAAAVVAVVAAPLFEETAFRLVLQGWLERRQMRPVLVAATPSDLVASEPPASASPVESWSWTLPGWAPIIISAGLFSLAHVGHGVAPFSLIILGLAMGYIYQRTHRIVPSIVCHMMFNGFTMLMLWLQLSIPSQ